MIRKLKNLIQPQNQTPKPQNQENEDNEPETRTKRKLVEATVYKHKLEIQYSNKTETIQNHTTDPAFEPECQKKLKEQIINPETAKAATCGYYYREAGIIFDKEKSDKLYHLDNAETVNRIETVKDKVYMPCEVEQVKYSGYWVAESVEEVKKIIKHDVTTDE